jgi:hypothetical protein
MYESDIRNRILLLRNMLIEIKATYAQIELLASELASLSDYYYSEARKESSIAINTEISKYNDNIERIRTINFDITSRTNLWYEFTKNKTELSKPLYPIAYMFKERELKKFISNMNEEISSVTIENRFIKEKLTLLEHQVEITALNKIKNDAVFASYEQQKTKIENMIEELKYLLPTIPGFCPITISIPEIDVLLDKLANIEAA